ncbi:hypothetical protein BUH_6739 [Burkholderia pseudomallei Pakistan 9]|nr:hypothetical protein BUH_6739 [Burkholderia pseudomallei Pakistan 9]EEP51085.1 hypothetical protein GBP346_B1795 [Burkholderia pseudomallei MSHR346]
MSSALTCARVTGPFDCWANETAGTASAAATATVAISDFMIKPP